MSETPEPTNIWRRAALRGAVFAALVLAIFEGLRMGGADVKIGLGGAAFWSAIGGLAYGLMYGGLRSTLSKLMHNLAAEQKKEIE